MQILDKDKLLTDGYLTFNLKEVDNFLYDELYKNFNKETFLNEPFTFRYDGCLKVPKNSKIKDDINNYLYKILTKFNLESDSKIYINANSDDNENEEIGLSLRVKGNYDSLKRFEKITNKFKYRTSQSWYFFSVIDNDKLNEILSDIYFKTIYDLYLEDIVNKTNYQQISISNGTDLTLYTKNNFIEPHEDGYVEGRLCVVLIYLNDDYQDGYGGELVINESIIVKPEFGNVVILDFTKNNVNHEVVRVIDDNFKRFASIKFFYK